MTESENSSAADLRRLIIGYRISQALNVAAVLGIADLLADGPKSVEDLAQATDSHALSLYRVLRLLASEGVFVEEAERRFRSTPLAEPLRRAAPISLKSRAEFDGDTANWRAWGNLLHSVRSGETALDHTFDVSLFEYLEQNVETSGRFNDMMVRQTQGWARDVIEAYDFDGVGTLVDVGGGHGAMLAAILTAHPHMNGILFDLPHVVEGAAPRLEAAGVAGRCEVLGGSFFDSLPEGGDAYLLKHVLHDWDDARCKQILANCRRTMAQDARLLVLEVLLAPGNEPDYGKALDVNMLVLTGGRERGEAEYRDLLQANGFTLARVVRTPGELSVIEGLPA